MVERWLFPQTFDRRRRWKLLAPFCQLHLALRFQRTRSNTGLDTLASMFFQSRVCSSKRLHVFSAKTQQKSHVAVMWTASPRGDQCPVRKDSVRGASLGPGCSMRKHATGAFPVCGNTTRLTPLKYTAKVAVSDEMSGANWERFSDFLSSLFANFRVRGLVLEQS